MARKPTQEQLFQELLDRYGSETAKAFMEAIDDLRSAADLQRLIAAIEAGNIEAAIAALHLDAAAYGPMLDVLRQTYSAGGQLASTGLSALADAAGAALVIRFDARNPRAEAWLRSESSKLVTRIVEDQREAVRTALTSAMERGANPRTAAMQIVGRIDRETGKREGGILGLSAPQERYVASARDELASGDPAQLKNYLGRTRRDKRFDRTIKKAIADEKPVPADIAAKAVRQYQNRLLALRGETIGKHEAFNALAASKHEAHQQAIDTGKVSEAAVQKTWRHLWNDNPRTQHIILDGRSVGFNELFIMPDGTAMLYPHDVRAPAKHVIGCHCQADYRIDFLANVR